MKVDILNPFKFDYDRIVDLIDLQKKFLKENPGITPIEALSMARDYLDSNKY